MFSTGMKGIKGILIIYKIPFIPFIPVGNLLVRVIRANLWLNFLHGYAGSTGTTSAGFEYNFLINGSSKKRTTPPPINTTATFVKILTSTL